MAAVSNISGVDKVAGGGDSEDELRRGEGGYEGDAERDVAGQAGGAGGGAQGEVRQLIEALVENLGLSWIFKEGIAQLSTFQDSTARRQK